MGDCSSGGTVRIGELMDVLTRAILMVASGRTDPFLHSEKLSGYGGAHAHFLRECSGWRRRSLILRVRGAPVARPSSLFAAFSAAERTIAQPVAETGLLSADSPGFRDRVTLGQCTRLNRQ